MTEIPMEGSGKRARFFPASGADESVSMMLELMSEVWVMRERIYALEQVAAESGLQLTEGIEAWRPSADQAEYLDQQRKNFIGTVLRSLEANHVPGLHLRRSLEAAAEADELGDLITDVASAA